MSDEEVWRRRGERERRARQAAEPLLERTTLGPYQANQELRCVADHFAGLVPALTPEQRELSRAAQGAAA